MSRHAPHAIALALLLAGCAAPQPQAGVAATSGAKAATQPTLFDDFGDLHRDIGSAVPEAQRYFD